MWAFAFVILVLALIAAIAVHLIWSKIEDLFKKKETSTEKRFVTKMNIQNVGSDNITSMLTKFYLQTGEQDSAVYYQRGYLSYTLLMEFLNSAGFKTKVRQSYCSYGNPQDCSIVLELTAPNGNISFMAFRKGFRMAFNSKGLPFYKAQYHSIDGLVDKDDLIEVIEGLQIGYSASLDNDNPMVKLIAEAIEIANLEVQYHYEGDEERMTIYRLSYSQLTGYNLQSTHRRLRENDIEELNTLYSPVEIPFGNETWTIEAGDAVEITVAALLNKQNIAFEGGAGIGKTYMADQVAKRIGDAGARVIFAPEALIRELSNVEKRSAFINLLMPPEGIEVQNILVIDQAELLLAGDENTGFHSEINTMMLDLMDGDLSKQLNLSLLLIYNHDSSKLNRKMFRPGRMGYVFKFKPLSREQAAKANKLVAKLYPDKVFDFKAFEGLLSRKTDDSGVNEITIAELINCYMDKAQHDMVIDLIRAAAAKFKKPFTAQPAQQVTDFFTMATESVAKNSAARIQLPNKMKKHRGKR